MAAMVTKATKATSVEPSRSRRPELQLPPAPENPSTTQVKVRGALTNLIASETTYVQSLELIKEELRRVSSTNIVIKQTADRASDIRDRHNWLHIDIAEALENLYEHGSISKGFINVFSSSELVDAYSEYINNFEAALAEIQRRRGSMRERWRKSTAPRLDTTQLSFHMIKPIQRIPQLILLIKDILKYTPYAHHDRQFLQEALTVMDSVAYQLNKCKCFSDQDRHARAIVPRLRPSVSGDDDKVLSLIRADKMDIVNMIPRQNACLTVQRVCLMNKILAFDTSDSDHGNPGVPQSQDMWYQDLRELELTTSIQFLNNATHLYAEGTLTLSSQHDDEVEDVLGQLRDLRDDTQVLQDMITTLTSLKRSYKLLEQVEEAITDIQKDIHKQHFKLLRMLYHRYIFISNKNRGDALLALCAESPGVKQDWCTDFLLAKAALDPLNTPSCWSRQEEDANKDRPPALLMEQVPLSIQPAETLITLNTTVKCVAHVNNPCYTGGHHGERLWVCSSNAQAGFVSIVPLHSVERVPIYVFKVAVCNLICAESVPEENVAGKPCDSVWISTTDSEILVFTVDPSISDTQKYHRQILYPGSTVVCMLSIDGKVYCGVRGKIVVYARDSDGGWSSSFSEIQLGSSASMSSIISVGNTLWAGGGDQIHVIQRGNLEDRVLYTIDGLSGQVNQMVKVGVGVFVSFHGKPEIILLHSENRRQLQSFSIILAINESKCVVEDSSPGSYEVTSLTASVGFLWVGTNVGIILTYPLPSLRACVPKITQRPHVALHGHCSAVSILLPLKYDPVSGLAKQKSKSERPVSDIYEGSEDSKVVMVEGQINVTPHEEENHPTVVEDLSKTIDEKDGKEGNMHELVSRKTLKEQTDETDHEEENRPSLEEDAFSTIDEKAGREKKVQEIKSLKTQGAVDETQTKVCDTSVEIHPFVDSENELDLASDEAVGSKRGSADQDSLTYLSLSGEKVNSLYPTGNEISDQTNSANVDQSRKARNWNTILVVSGGNGYVDLREGSDTLGDHRKDPCLLFWMYKV